MIIGSGVTMDTGFVIDGATAVLASFNGSSIANWTQLSTGAVDNTIGNPSPSWKFTDRGMYKNLNINFLNKTFVFDVRPSTNADGGIVFANNAGGTGGNRGAIRIFQGVNRDQGMRAGSNGGWLYIGVGGTTTSSFPTADIWYNIKMQVASNRVCTWYIDGVLQASTYTLPVGYTSTNSDTYFGFITNTSTIYFDNFIIYDGIV